MVDTDVLVYAYDTLSPLYLIARAKLEHLGGDRHSLAITFQTIREFCSVLSRQNWAPKSIPPEVVVRHASSLIEDFILVPETTPALALLLELIREYGIRGRQVFDANLVATMLANDINVLLTHNPRDFRRFENRIEVIALN